jgi:hypothetical protein
MLYVEAALGETDYSAVALATRGMSWGVLFGRGKIAPAAWGGPRTARTLSL